ncbi:protein nirG [Dechloromonas denitrificans]|uniref:Siroheme decarboxylase NirG subunit n=1 Tax=Dechloromonas denitrificans TaxID=281362 RepID=A0A133XHQ7_9RHOO|nr:Lrp/AsnC family transcriptional regulator [Dechloromonas denitrificans]KXB30416.1 protein nirG [Dechloromonas denitrificans]
MRELDAVDREIIAKMQGDFPICARPYAALATKIGITEDELLVRLGALLNDKVLTRFGPMYQIERMGGAFVLAALAAPEERYDEVTALVNALPQVAHNYRREHALNMWFVLATETPAGIAEAVARIEADTGLPVYAFPKEQEYFVEMKLEARV